MKAILLPVFAQVFLTLALAVALGRSRVAAVRRGETAVKDIALGQDAWPDNVRKFSRSYQNQFELPTLFYALVALAIGTGSVDAPLIAGAWLFVAARYVHAFIHVTGNHVLRRFRAFIASFAVLALMWAYFALRILFT